MKVAHAPAVIASLNFDRPVPGSLVHKTGDGEVFVTDSRQVGDDLIVIAGVMPRSHAFYGDTAATATAVDVIALCELGRQALYIVTHQYLGAPAGSRYLIRELRCTLAPGPRRRQRFPTPRVVLSAHVIDVPERDGRPCGINGLVDVHGLDGTPLGRFELSASWMPPAVWQSLRDRSRRAAFAEPEPVRACLPLGAAEVGRGVPGNVVIGGAEEDGGAYRARLQVDPGYTPLFDHPHSHIPGMVQLEAGRQLAVWSASRHLDRPGPQIAVHQIHATFPAFAEMDLQTEGAATLGDDHDGLLAQVELRQGERVAAAMGIRLS